jgi:hypothetical protein
MKDSGNSRNKVVALPVAKTPCNLWAVGPCRFGYNCKFSHEGEAGAAKAAPTELQASLETGLCECGNKNRSDAKFCDSCGAEACPEVAPMPVELGGKPYQLHLKGKC